MNSRRDGRDAAETPGSSSALVGPCGLDCVEGRRMVSRRCISSFSPLWTPSTLLRRQTNDGRRGWSRVRKRTRPAYAYSTALILTSAPLWFKAKRPTLVPRSITERKLLFSREELPFSGTLDSQAVLTDRRCYRRFSRQSNPALLPDPRRLSATPSRLARVNPRQGNSSLSLPVLERILTKYELYDSLMEKSVSASSFLPSD